MTRTGTLWVAFVLAAAAPAATGEDKGIHITGQRRQSFTWQVTDAAAYRWDISSYGQVSDGTNDAYDGGMRLTVNGSTWSYNSTGALSEDGREVEIGPWTQGSLRVWRRIYVDPEIGYCRWIDIFENTTSSAQNVAAQYYSNMGGSTQTTFTTSGKTDLDAEKDWGIVTGYGAGNSSRPEIVHVFATPNSTFKPRFTWTRNSDSLYYRADFKVPAKQTLALCFFEAQRRGWPEATKFLKGFDASKELRKVPPALRRILHNMGGAVLVLGTLELPRREKQDLVVKRNGDELPGAIQNRKYVVEAFYGRLELPADRVVGFKVPAEDEPFVRVGLVDGQVVSGNLMSGPLEILLDSGNKQTLPPGAIATAAYRLSEQRPEQIKISRPMVVLRSGERLFFEADDLDTTYHTEYGDVKLKPDDLQVIYLDTPDGGLHRVVFSNGSILSGLLTAEDLQLRLDLGKTLKIRRQLVHYFAFPPPAKTEEVPLAEMALRNDDVLRGRIADKTLAVDTRFGRITVAPSDIETIAFARDADLGKVQLKLRDGTSVSGRFVGEHLRFKIHPGPVLPVFVGHIVQVECPEGSHPTTRPTTRPATTRPAATSAAGRAAEPVRLRPDRDEAAAQADDIRRRLVMIAAMREKLAAAGNPNPGVMAQLEAQEAELRKVLADVEARRHAAPVR